MPRQPRPGTTRGTRSSTRTARGQSRDSWRPADASPGQRGAGRGRPRRRHAGARRAGQRHQGGIPGAI
eukprot:9060624-Heterocapsa_arctica.AAC.1